ncbi:MAG: chemotaxis protein CheW, partial [Sulfurimonas sp.]|nr:chemotaxis protein CheW [Sulfurimonas sp.]
IRSLNELSVDVHSIHAGMASLSSELHGQIAKQQLIMGAMQDKLMRTRMTPMSAISRAFFRTVRNTARQLDKNVRLTVTGDDVFMDRFIWSKITDPIMHILRNCIDHGVESARVRSESGKPETASIRIEAQQLGSFVILRIADDGAGIDTGRLREKLASAGLVSKIDTLTDEELLPYLFRTGLSTKDEISHISGRGVGLDVVQKNIQELRGTVRVQTQPGQGTVFELRIPITLSVNKAILIVAGDKQYAIPLQDVVEIKSASMADLSKDGLHLQWKDELLPVKDLAAILQLRDLMEWQASAVGSLLTLIVRGGKGHVAVVVDLVKEQREIVVKNLGTHLTHVQGVSGVTILGDGSLIPVLNLSELVDESLQTTKAVGHSPPSFVRELPLQILIVDDSISVRQTIARLVRHQSWKPEMAVDGVDAL